MNWIDDAIRGSDADPHAGGDEHGDLFLDPWADPAYVRDEDAE